jgi:hypothetical protein
MTMMEFFTLTIPGTVVSKKNSKIATMVGGKNVLRRAIILPSSAYKKWEKQARLSLMGKYYPVKCPVWVQATFYYKGNRPDLSGACESIGDCLEGFLWNSDSQIESWDGSRLVHDLKNPRTEIIVRDFQIKFPA